MFFIFNPENLYREDRKISSTQCSLEYKTFCDYGFPVNFFKMERSSFTKTEIQRFFFQASTQTIATLPYPTPLDNVPSFFSSFEKAGTDSSWQVSTYQSHCVMCAIHVALEPLLDG